MLPVPHTEAVERCGPVYGIVIWKTVEGSLERYAIPANEDHLHARGWWTLLAQADGKYIGRDEENDGLCFLFCATAEPTDDALTEWAGVLLPYRLPVDHTIEKELITRVYCSGFI